MKNNYGYLSMWYQLSAPSVHSIRIVRNIYDVDFCMSLSVIMLLPYFVCLYDLLSFETNDPVVVQIFLNALCIHYFSLYQQHIVNAQVLGSFDFK